MRATMRLSRRRFLLAGSAALLATACTPSAPSSSATASIAPSGAAGAGGAGAAPPLKIGVLVPYTESAIDADVGASQKRAADLFLKRRGGALAGRAVTLVYADESVDAAFDRVKIQQLLEKDGVDVLLGGAAATTAYALRDAAEAKRLVYLDTCATANALTRAVAGCRPSCESRYVFRTSASAWQLSEPLGEWASRKGATSFFLSYADDAFGTESAAAFVEGLAKHGGAATGRAALPSGGDAATAVAAITLQPARNVFAAFQTDGAEAFLRAWADAGMTAAGYRLYGPGLLTEGRVLKATKQAALGTVTTLFWSSELDNAENRAFREAFAAEYRDEDTGAPLVPDVFAVEMWDAMRALEVALTRTKGDAADRAALVAALEGARFKSPRGDLAFDPGTHGPVQDVHVREVRAAGGAVVNAIVDTIAAVADPGR